MISIALPVHDMSNKEFFFRRALDSISYQSYKDFEVIVTDNSFDNSLEEILKQYDFNWFYFENPKIGMAPNTNMAIEQSTGDLIKILYMDDFLYDKHSLRNIINNFGHGDNWLVTGCIHEYRGEFSNVHMPKYNDEIHTGLNTIGSPSVLTIRNHQFRTPLFDENMTWLLDCHYYKQLFEKYGLPKILNEINVAIGLGEHQMTNILSNEEKLSELNYLKKQYE